MVATRLDHGDGIRRRKSYPFGSSVKQDMIETLWKSRLIGETIGAKGACPVQGKVKETDVGWDDLGKKEPYHFEKLSDLGD